MREAGDEKREAVKAKLSQEVEVGNGWRKVRGDTMEGECGVDRLAHGVVG